MIDNSLKNLGLSSGSEERKYITNKRDYEITQIAYKLCKLANHYRCEIFGLEDLDIKSSDLGKEKRQTGSVIISGTETNLLI